MTMKIAWNRRAVFFRAPVISFAVLFAGAFAMAQNGGLRGKVVDQAGEPVEGAEVLIEFLDGVTREIKSSSNENGDFVQVGIRGGNYRVTLRKGGYDSATKEVRIRMGPPTDIGQMVMAKLAEGALSREEVASITAEIKQQFNDGLAAVDRQDYAAALAAFQEAAEMEPEFPEAHFNIGFVLVKMNEPDKAIPSYEKAGALRPDYYDAWVELGNLYNDKQEYAKSMEAFERAIQIDATEISTLYNYGAVGMNAGEMEKAQGAFEKVLAIDPEHATANFQMGMVFVNQARNDDAIPYLEKYLALEPEGPHAPTVRGVLDFLKKEP